MAADLCPTSSRTIGAKRVWLGRGFAGRDPRRVTPYFRYNTAISQSSSRCRMKKTHVSALGIVVMLLVTGNLEARAAGCDPIGNVRFICDQVGPEDLAAVPGSEWVLSSGMAANGAIRLINLRDKSTTVLFPSAASKARPNKKTYESCPGPIGSEGDRFRAHGLYLRPGPNAVHTLYVVHHGDRESIEVFEFDARPQAPTLTWIGCAVAPDPIGLNSVVGLSDGGFITTNFSPRIADATARAEMMKKMMAGGNNGEGWEWHTASGWKIVPGREVPGPNGIEMAEE